MHRSGSWWWWWWSGALDLTPPLTTAHHHHRTLLDHRRFHHQVSGACVFSGQPFNCAVSGFAGDTPAWHDAIEEMNGSASSTNNHCKSSPNVVDVGSLVDYPRRHCGQNPVVIPNCFDDVNYLKKSRVFLFRGTHDNVSMPGAIENVDGLLAQMITQPQASIKVVRDLPFGYGVPVPTTPCVICSAFLFSPRLHSPLSPVSFPPPANRRPQPSCSEDEAATKMGCVCFEARLCVRGCGCCV